MTIERCAAGSGGTRGLKWRLHVQRHNESGVTEALEMLQKEFDLAMALSGSSRLEEITDLLGRV